MATLPSGIMPRTTLYGFSNNNAGGYPHGILILSANTLYRTANLSGNFGNGTVFSIALPLPELTITHYGGDAILTWPTHPGGFGLQSITNLAPATVRKTVSASVVVVNGHNIVIPTPSPALRRFTA